MMRLTPQEHLSFPQAKRKSKRALGPQPKKRTWRSKRLHRCILDDASSRPRINLHITSFNAYIFLLGYIFFTLVAFYSLVAFKRYHEFCLLSIHILHIATIPVPPYFFELPSPHTPSSHNSSYHDHISTVFVVCAHVSRTSSDMKPKE